ncbi:MAG TPA: hypothetical protein VIK59_11195 [Verrucomicrobiae bacterium]
MFHPILPVLEALFSNNEKLRQPMNFEWRLISRYGRPFLLLPTAPTGARAGLKIYSAQRCRAKIWRALLPMLFKTPVAHLFQHVRFQADASSEIMQFLAQQVAMPATQLSTIPIMFGGMDYKSRVVLLLCDENQRPVRVVKVGLNSQGQKATDDEAALLEQLPADARGCARITGRLSTSTLSAFAMDYFPGDSPVDDDGMEYFFHGCLNSGPSVPLESLQLWRNMAAKVPEADLDSWHILNAALAGKTVRTAVYHGDFSPWNIRAINSKNFQVLDWERGQLQGVPGWDWFHFIVQTSILAKRHSAERAAAEIEQLIHSSRFKKYADAAEISGIIQPLLLGYLLHYLWVFRPSEGGKTTRELFDLLSARWQMTPPRRAAAATSFLPSGLGAGAKFQIKSALADLSNLFWEPSVNSKVQPSLGAQFPTHWPLIFLSGLLFAIVATIQGRANAHMIFLPFYLVPCALLTWKLDRRWGILMATIAALIGPIIQSIKELGFHHLEIVLWNSLMRFIALQSCVLFVDHIRKKKSSHSFLNDPPAKFTEHWAVILTSGLLFIMVGAIDYFTNPNMGFLPLYLLPCMMLTLVLDFTWGIVTAFVAAVASSLIEYFTSPIHGVIEIYEWNFFMRLAFLSIVILMLNRIRRESILFFPHKAYSFVKPQTT